MIYAESKVYSDGSHYIAIPHTTRPSKRRHITNEETITIVPQSEIEENTNEENENNASVENSENDEKIDKNSGKSAKNTQNLLKIGYLTTRKELFNDLYLKYIDLPKKERRKKIIDEMQQYFKDRKSCEIYVDKNFERKMRNLTCRKVRMARKANLAKFNYFCTFTYDSEKHTEQSFRKKLKNCLSLFSSRKDWKYMGVWERSPELKRLHFHGLFNIPEGTMPGELKVVRDYDTVGKRMQESVQSSYFNERFGRSDIKELVNNPQELSKELAYLMKYIEKTGEKIVYSKGLAQYFISDILEEDVASRIGQEDQKLLLFDDFRCWDEGVFIGKVCEETIKQMRKSN